MSTIVMKTKTRKLSYQKVDSIYFLVKDITYGNVSFGYFQKISETIFKGTPCLI